LLRGAAGRLPNACPDRRRCGAGHWARQHLGRRRSGSSRPGAEGRRYKRLAELADLMPTLTPAANGASQSKQAPKPGTSQTPQQVGRDLVVSWSSDTVARARQLGLAARHLESRAELAALRQYAWSPASDESRHSTIRQVALPSGSPDGLRDRVEVFMIHPLANSGGARHLPTLVAEDVLVEDFPDHK